MEDNNVIQVASPVQESKVKTEGSSVFTVRVSLLSTGQLSSLPLKGLDAQSAKVGDLRKAIEAVLRVPVAQQRVYHRGLELLNDEVTLAATGIAANDILQLALRPGTVAVSRPPMAYQPVLYSMAHEEIIPPLSEPLAEKFVVIAGLARIIKILAIMDMVFLMFYTMVAWPFLIGFLAALCGYYGATYYRPGPLMLYLLYELSLAGFRIWYYIEYQDHFTYRDAMILLTVLTVFLELWVASVIFRLLILMCGSSAQELQHLADVFIPDYGFWTAPQVVRIVETTRRHEKQRRGSDGQVYYLMEVPV